MLNSRQTRQKKELRDRKKFRQRQETADNIHRPYMQLTKITRINVDISRRRCSNELCTTIPDKRLNNEVYSQCISQMVSSIYTTRNRIHRQPSMLHNRDVQKISLTIRNNTQANSSLQRERKSIQKTEGWKENHQKYQKIYSKRDN